MPSTGFPWIRSWNLHHAPFSVGTLLPSFYRWGNWVSEKLGNLLKFTELMGSGTGMQVQVSLSLRPVLQAPICPACWKLSRRIKRSKEDSISSLEPSTKETGLSSERGEIYWNSSGKWLLHQREPHLRPYLYFRVILQQHFRCLWLQFPFENSTFYLGKKDTVQFIPLENGQLPVGLGKVFLLLQSKGPPQVLLF